MIILGKNNDDKGIQLENLTKHILQNLGYQNIGQSIIQAGGAEIDVTGEFFTPVPGESRVQKMICECKAHQDPTNMTDWMKFLGKVYFEQTQRNEDVLGCFISLSGVNGNVRGNYESYKLKKSNVQILNGDNIIEIIKPQYHLCSAEKVSQNIQTHTSRMIKSIDIAYYQKELFWVVAFEKGEYSLLSESGYALVGDKQNEITKLVEKNTAFFAFIDLFAEAEAQRQTVILQKVMLAAMVARNGVFPITITSSDSTQDNTINANMPNTAVPLNDFNRIIDILEKEKGWIELSTTDGELRIKINNNGKSPYIIDIFNFMLTGDIPKEVIRDFIGTYFYDKHIDKEFIDTILKIQGDIPLDNQQFADLENLLKLSPSSIPLLLHPIEMITHGRNQEDFAPDDRLNREHIKFLFNAAFSALHRDFTVGALSGYFYKVRGIREIESLQSIKVKSNQKITLEGNLLSRIGIAIAVEDMGGSFLHISLINDTLQPWESSDPDQPSIDKAYNMMYADLDLSTTG
jgi:hypothetical protein